MFKNLKPEMLSNNFFKSIGTDWMLISAGEKDSFNMMTASWGGTGILWNKPVVQIFVRPQRYTHEFIEKCDYFTCSFFPPEYHHIHDICGSKSGRDINKAAATGLIPCFDGRSVWYEQADLVLICKKIYRDVIKGSCILDKKIDSSMYPEKDYHTAYIGEIVEVLAAE